MTETIDFIKACHVKDPETGELLAVERTHEYGELITAFHAATCQHAATTPLRVKIANEAVQVRNCCDHCGERIGTAVSQRDKAWVTSLPWQSEEHATGYTKRREDERQAMLLDLARRQYAERGRFTKSYTAYLGSDLWAAKRKLVLKRCGGTCEGCGVKAATEVHHKTYDHLFDEFLFELLCLCHDCHERITKDRAGEADDAEQDKAIIAAIGDCF